MSAHGSEPAPSLDGTRVAGCDLGKATAHFVVGRVDAAGGLSVEAAEAIPHLGRPMDALADAWQRLRLGECAALGATGLHAASLVAPALPNLPADACLQAALRHRDDLAGPVNVVSMGARGYAVLSRGVDGRFQYAENDKCSSGTGETMVKIAQRFGMSLQEADACARAAAEAIPITARCSVFAKSEMTHFGNQGRPADALLRGYFRSIASYVAALLARIRVDGPVLAIGGCTRIGALVEALGEALGGVEVRVPDGALTLEAHGAAQLAADHLRATPARPLPLEADALVRLQPRRFAVLTPAREAAQRVTRLALSPVPDTAAAAPTILGIDLGSTGSKAALVSVGTGDLVLDVYDRTRGNPVGAARRLVGALLERARPDVRAVALTGSGREAAATVFRAAYPQLADRIVVENEIVAHATAAIRADPGGGESLSVVEIGGQDAKFVQIVGGQIVESDMNKACSAGTGSFLEEQAQFYGVDDIEDFTREAQEATRPPDLGQMCTVFVSEAASEAHGEGFARADLFGGFQYSVIHNYMHRVMGQRTFGERIFFQGKPATGPSLAWTLAQVTGREVVVPPNPGAMGAWGIGLVARRELGEAALEGASPFDLPAVLEAEVVARAEFQCKDKRCATLCTIERSTVQVAGTRSTVLSGGACPKYEVAAGPRKKLPPEAPSPFDERRAILASALRRPAADPGRPVVGVPAVGALVGVLPWTVTLLRELGLAVRVLWPDAKSLARGEERCYSYDACAPVKVAHGVADADVDTLFFPKLRGLADPDGPGGATCPMEQALPEMIREALHARGAGVRVVHPVLDLARGPCDWRLVRPLYLAAEALGADRTRLGQALQEAARVQAQLDRDLAAVGARALAWGQEHGVPAVLVCGSLHVIHDPVISAGIPRALRESGVLALPMDCFPIPEATHDMPRVAWADARRALRAAVAARARGGVYPLLLASFGCGPSSFVETIFGALMEGYPHTALESDGHGGTAGYVTRVQAFLHTVRGHDRRPSPVPASRLQLVEPLPSLGAEPDPSARLVVFSVSDRVSPLVAAAYRARGFDAVPSGPADDEALALGRQDCSGKECVPYQLIWGSFRKHLREPPNGKRTVLMQVSGEGMCRNCMFSIKDQITLERRGLSARVSLRHLETDPAMGWDFTARVYNTIATWDVLGQLAAWHRPLEREPGEVDALYELWADRLQALADRPLPRGLARAAALVDDSRALLELAADASAAFATIPRPPDPRRRTVLLSGDVYLRVDAFGSDDLVRRLNRRGLQVLLEPVSALTAYMADERVSELMGLPTARLPNAVMRAGMAAARRQLYGRVRRHHPWLPTPDLRAMRRAASRVIGRYPVGEAPMTIGSVLHHWEDRLCDGVVVVSPWGCGPALVAESLLRHQVEIPILFVYRDGTPLDTRRLDAFAFRLLGDPPRIGGGFSCAAPGDASR